MARRGIKTPQKFIKSYSFDKMTKRTLPVFPPPKDNRSIEFVDKLNKFAFQKIIDVDFASKLISERLPKEKFDSGIINNLSSDTKSGDLFEKNPVDETLGVFFVDINFLRNRRGNTINQTSNFKSVDNIKKIISSKKKLSSVPIYNLKKGVVDEGNHRVEALYQLGYKSVPIYIANGWD